MKAMVLTAKSTVKMMDFPEPSLNPEGVVVKVEAAAICNSTDLRIYDADDPTRVWPNQPWPFVMGHEMCGRIVDVGDQVQGWAVGDRIAGWCPPYGGFAEYAQMYPGYMAAVKVPDDMSSELAAMLELSIGTTRYFMPESVKQKIGEAENVFVAGLGPSGLLYVREALLLGAKNIYASDRHPERRDFAMKMGATEVFSPEDDPFKTLKSRNTALDFFIDTTGRDLSEPAIELLTDNGAVIPFGVGFDWNSKRRDLDSKRIELVDASVDEGRLAAPIVLDWIMRGDLPAGDLITEIIALENLEYGLESIRKRNNIKVIVNID